MVDELLLHGCVELDVGWLVNAAVESVGRGAVGRLAVGLSVQVLALDTGNVTGVA